MARIPEEYTGSNMVSFAICYVLGVLFMVVFMRLIGPKLLKTTLPDAVAEHLRATGGETKSADTENVVSAIQLRAYRVGPAAAIVGSTVGDVESQGPRNFEVVALYRRGEMLLEDLTQETPIQAGDVMVVVGNTRAVYDRPDDDIQETVEERYLTHEMKHAGIVVTQVNDGKRSLERELDDRGVLVRSVLRRGKRLSAKAAGAIQRGDVLEVTGLARTVDAIAAKCGYLKDNGPSTDMPWMLLAIAAAMVIGGFQIGSFSLGGSCVSMLMGVWLGWLNQRHPRRAYVPTAALSFMRSLGLNMFLACSTLNAALDPEMVFSAAMLKVALFAIPVALGPLLLGLLFGRRVLKLDAVELLGGLSGSGTCTPALDALEEAAGRSAFTPSYTPAYVVGNLTLTAMGLLFMAML